MKEKQRMNSQNCRREISALPTLEIHCGEQCSRGLKRVVQEEGRGLCRKEGCRTTG